MSAPINEARESLPDKDQRDRFSNHLLGGLSVLVDPDQLDEAIERALIYAAPARCPHGRSLSSRRTHPCPPGLLGCCLHEQEAGA